MTAEAPGRSASRARRSKPTLVATILAPCLVLLMYWPTIDSLDSTLPWNLGDPALNTWILGWESHAVVREPSNFFQGNIYYPYGEAIKYSEMMLPLVPVFGLIYGVSGNPVLAHNLVILLLALFTLVMTYLLARRLIGSGAALVAALGFTFSGYVFMHVAHLQLLTLGFFPLALLAFYRFLEKQRLIDGVWLGLASAALTTACLYYGAIWLTCLSVMIVFVVITRPRPTKALWAAIAAAAATSAVLIGPVAYVYARFQRNVGFVRASRDADGLKLVDLLTPAPGSVVYRDLLEWTGARSTNLVEHGFFLGFVIPALALIGVSFLIARRVNRRPGGSHSQILHAERGRSFELRLLLVTGLVSIIVAIGPSAWGMPMPFAFLQAHVPGFDGIRAVARLAVPAFLMACVLAAFGLDRLLRRRTDPTRLIAVALVSALVLLELAVQPFRAAVDTRPEVVAIRQTLREAPEGPVVELPMREIADAGFAFVEGPRKIASIGDWRPRFNGSSAMLPPGYMEDVVLLNAFPSPDALERASQLGLRFVVLHGAEVASDQAYDFDRIARTLELLPPGAQWERSGDSWLVDLGP